MARRQPSTSPPRKSKGTQTENEKEKEEEDDEEERKNFVKKVDAMARIINQRAADPAAATASKAKWKA